MKKRSVCTSLAVLAVGAAATVFGLSQQPAAESPAQSPAQTATKTPTQEPSQKEPPMPDELDPEAQREADAALRRAVEAGDTAAARRALADGADLETRDEYGRTPLLVAVTEDDVATARLLVAEGADPDALDNQHDTPWLVTGVTGSVRMLETLLPADPDMTIRNRYGGLSPIPAGERGHVDYIRRVVQTGVDIDHVNDLGWTAMLEAIILGDGSRRYQEIVQILLDSGADASIADKDGVTPLEHARAHGYDEIVRILER